MAEKGNHSSRRILALNIRRLRTALEWSQHDLAAEAEVRQALISSIEVGTANPTLESLDKLSAALSVTIAQLFETRGE